MDYSSPQLHERQDKLLANLSWTQGLARRLVRSQEAAEELVQETWSRVLQNPPPRGSKTRPWIAAVMHRTLGDSFRSAGRRRRREAQFAQDHSRITDSKHDQELSLHQDLVERVKELDPPLRRVVLLRYFDDLSLAEIARREGLEVSGVKSRLSRALERLRDRLRESPDTTAGAWFLLQLPKSQPALPAVLLVPVALLAMKTLFSIIALLVLSALGLRLLTPADDNRTIETVSSVVEESPDAKLENLQAPESLRMRTATQAVQASQVLSVPSPDIPPVTDAATALTMRVVDETGEPQIGAPVSLMGDSKHGATIWRGHTDESGEGSVPIEAVERARETSGGSGFLAALDVPCGAEGIAILDLDHLPAAPVELVMSGPRGDLVVEFMDELGNALMVRPLVMLEGAVAPGGRKSVNRQPETSATSVTFRSVALDSRFQLSALMPGPWDVILRDVTGPTIAGERKVVELRFKTTGPRIVGRLLNPDGTPLTRGDELVDGYLHTLASPPLSGQLSMAIAADGRFEAGIKSGLNAIIRGGFPTSSPCKVYFRCLTERFDTGCLLANAQGAVPVAGETLDLGDITLHPAQARIAGIVRSPNGEPAAGAIVRVVPLDPNPAQRPPSFPTLSARTNNEGHFAFYRFPLDESFALRASKSPLASPNSAPINDGDLGVELTLRPTMSLSGNIVPLEGLETSMIQVKVLKGAASPTFSRRGRVAQDWTFKIDGLADHPCTLQVTDADGRQALMEINSVRPASPEAAQDQRLEQVDLKGSALPIRMRIEDIAGQPISKGSADVAGTNVSFAGGVLQAVIPWTDGEVEIGAPGMRPQRFPLSSLPELVILDAGLRVRLLAPSPWPSEVDRGEVVLNLSPLKSGGGRPDILADLAEARVFGTQDSVELIVPQPGTYHVRWSKNQTVEELLQAGKENRLLGDLLQLRSLFEACSKQKVEVVEQSGAQEIDLSR